MSNEYWTDNNLGSTISFSTTDDGGNTTKIHMSVIKGDTVNSNNTTVRDHTTITQNVSDTINASIFVTPIVSYDAENAFAFDTQATEKVNFSFIRKNPNGKIHIRSTPSATTLTEIALPWDDQDDDDRFWSNRKWMERFSDMINRWQVRTDGCVMKYEPLDNTLQNPMSINVYLHNIQFKQDISSNEIISGSVEAQIGSMTANAARPENSDIEVGGYNDKKLVNDMRISMTSSDGLATYILYCNDLVVNGESFNLNCVTDYSLKGGPEQPFEYLTMNISKKRLSIIAPNLLNDIVPGRNRVIIDAMGQGQFIVTKCSTQSTTYKIVAYSIYEIYRSITIGGSLYFGNGVSTSPFSIIKTVLTTTRRVGSGSNISPVYFESNMIKYAYFSKNDNWADDFACNFGNKASIWYVLTVCSLKLNCKVWFSDNYAYVVDTSITEEMLANTARYGITTNMGGYRSLVSKIYLNTSDPFPLSATEEEMNFTKSVCDTISLGDEGAETICNSVRVQFSADKDSRYTVDTDTNEKDTSELTRGGYDLGITATGVVRILTGDGTTYQYTADAAPYPAIAQSQAKYGIKETVYKIPEIGVTDANDIAVKVANSYCDGEQSVGFEIKETHRILVTEDNISEWAKLDPNIEEGEYIKYWQRYFPTFAQADNIYDYSNDLMISNMSNFLCTSMGTDIHISNTNYDEDMTVSVPRGTTLKITPMDIPISIHWNWNAGVGYYNASEPPTGFLTSLKVFDMDDNDITSKTQIKILDEVDQSTALHMIYPTFEITVMQNCYMRMCETYLTLVGQATYHLGGKLIFQLKDGRVKMPNKLCLSTFEHHFPEGTTRYWFGIMKPTDITQNSSEVANALYNQ